MSKVVADKTKNNFSNISYTFNPLYFLLLTDGFYFAIPKYFLVHYDDVKDWKINYKYII